MTNIKAILFFCFICIQLVCASQLVMPDSEKKLKVIIAGLSHDHVNGILAKGKSGDIIILGIAEPNEPLCQRMKTAHHLPDSIFYKSLSAALKNNRPDLVMVYNAPSEHVSAVETSLPLKIPVMLEKPLCFSNADAAKMKFLSEKYKTKVFTNYPSIWYTSFAELLKRVNEKKEIGTVNKMEMHGGHKGPVEIGCSKDFTNWLTDPVKNGGGAITDFGCYGASVMTELMLGKAPLSVFAITRKHKPAVYPKADDDATIILEYPAATGIIEASWNWPFTIMDVEAYGNNGYLYAAQFNVSGENPSLQSKSETGNKTEAISIPQYKDEIEYLTAVIKDGAPDNNKLLSLEHNIIVVRILDAARRSAKEGRKISL